LGVYLENFRLYGDLQDLLIGSLRALTSSIDAKDPYTCGHSERVAVISHWVAEKMGLPAEEVQTIYLAGLLHDVGKIGVSELVLQKPGRLLPEEFEQIKQHPQIGSNILSGIRQMAEVSRTVLTHHERYDGKGYPMGLRGQQIPLAGRIIKLADSFDAMISSRVYRGALPVVAALSEIRLYSGTQFDPDVARIFLKGDLEELMARLSRIDSSKSVFEKNPLAIPG
jgi:putative nucleotidyltransferase with HDIG domain